MTHWRTNFILSLVVFIFSGCNLDTVSNKEASEFKSLERALGSVVTSPVDDRDFLLQEIAQMDIQNQRIREIRDLCVESYRLFGETTKHLAGAREKTVQTEAALAAAREKKQKGMPLGQAETRQLQSMSQAAADSLREVTETLDRAEALIKACEENRNQLRISILDP